MKTQWINTNDRYHQIIAAPDVATREQIYHEFLLAPWQQMMAMMAGMFNADPDDAFAGARAWNWLLPEDLTATPAALQQLEAANAWTIGAQALADGVARFSAYADRIPFDEVTGWLVLGKPDPSGTTQREGYTGAVDWTQPRLIVQYHTPNDYNLPRLPGIVVHELHHLIRLNVFPWDMANTSVADYIIHEGLAESFAAALYGEEIVGYYVTDCNEAEIDTARTLIRDGLAVTGFDAIRGYIFGDGLAEQWHFTKVGMPDYGGYAIGYRVVQAYLRATGTTVEEATFVPADEIIRTSKFFA